LLGKGRPLTKSLKGVRSSHGSLGIVFRPFGAALSNSIHISTERRAGRRKHTCLLDVHVPTLLILLSPLPNVLPWEVRSQTIHFPPVAPDEEDQVFGREEAGWAEVGE